MVKVIEVVFLMLMEDEFVYLIEGCLTRVSSSNNLARPLAWDKVRACKACRPRKISIFNPEMNQLSIGKKKFSQIIGIIRLC